MAIYKVDYFPYQLVITDEFEDFEETIALKYHNIDHAYKALEWFLNNKDKRILDTKWSISYVLDTDRRIEDIEELIDKC